MLFVASTYSQVVSLKVTEDLQTQQLKQGVRVKKTRGAAAPINSNTLASSVAAWPMQQ